MEGREQPETNGTNSSQSTESAPGSWPNEEMGMSYPLSDNPGSGAYAHGAGGTNESSIDEDTDSDLSSLTGSSGDERPLRRVPAEAVPVYNGYQLLGDETLAQLAQKYLHYSLNGTSGIGYCINCQQIRSLTETIQAREFKIMKKVIIYVGTFDMIMGTSLKTMCEDFSHLLEVLKENKVKRFVVLTLPPILVYIAMEPQWKLVLGFNNYLRRLQAHDTCVLDVYKIFVTEQLPILTELANNTLEEEPSNDVVSSLKKDHRGLVLPVCELAFFRKVKRSVLLNPEREPFQKIVPINFDSRKYLKNNLDMIYLVGRSFIQVGYYRTFTELRQYTNLTLEGIWAIFQLIKRHVEPTLQWQ